MATIRLASRLGRARISPTVAFSARAEALKAAGRDVISLAAGEPDFDTPDHIVQAAKRAMCAGQTHYTLVEGIPVLREAICHKFSRDNGLIFQPDQVSVSSGGKQVIFNALMATLEPGDEVIVPAPYWVSYPDIVLLSGAEPVIVPTRESDGFRMSAAQLERAITPRTRWVILNSPSNPTGAIYRPEDFIALGEVLCRHPDVWILTDDIYETIVYEPETFVSFAAAVPALADRTLLINGLSKSHAMTGWRIGYGAGDVDLIRAMNKIQGQSTLHPCSISQWAAVEALTGPQEAVRSMRNHFARRRDQTIAALGAIEGLHCFVPGGAFYLFFSVESHQGRKSRAGVSLQNDHDWVMALLDEGGVGLVPGTAFGGAGYCRLSFAAADEVLARACQRIACFAAGLSP